MLGSLRSKYRSLFLTTNDYHERGLILSDDILLNLEAGVDQTRPTFLPMPAVIPEYPIGEKIGEGLTSETFIFPEKLTPFPLVVQFQPVTIDETQHLAHVSSLLTQLYGLCPHIISYLGYYLTPSNPPAEISEFQQEEEPFSSTECRSPSTNSSEESLSQSNYEANFFSDDGHENHQEIECFSEESDDSTLQLSHDCYAFLY